MYDDGLAPIKDTGRYAESDLHSPEPFDPDAHCTVLKLCRFASVPLDELRQALESGEDWTARDQYGDTALTYCARMGKFEAFKIVYEFDKKHRPIEGIVDGSLVATVTGPLDLIAGNALGKKLSPGLLMAAGGLSPRVIHLLTEHLDTLELDPRQKEMATQFFASLVGVNELEVVSNLIANGTILQPDKVPIIEACWSGERTEILDYLIADRVDMDEVDHEGKTALHKLGTIAFANYHPQTDFIVAKKVLAANANVNARDNKLRVPLMAAAAQGCGPLVRLYSDAGADWDAVDIDGRSVLDHLNVFVGDIKRSFDSLAEFKGAYSPQV